MQIMILGAGRVGRALGTQWSEVGHDVTYAVRDVTDPRHQDLTSVASPADAIVGSDVVVIALPWAAVQSAVTDLAFGDAVIIDATNPLAADARQFSTDRDRELSGAEQIAGWTSSSRVVKAFNSTGSANMADPRYPAAQPMMPIAGDDADAKAITVDLALEIGFDALDAGPLAAAVDLEHLAMMWIRLAYALGQGPDIAFALLRR